MRKLSLFMLMAVGLLISGNLRADNVCKIVGGSEYATLTEAITAVEDGVETTIQMIADDVIEEATDGYIYEIPTGKSVVLDLNGKRIYRYNHEYKNTSIFNVKGTLSVDDNSQSKNGEIVLKTDYGTGGYSAGRSSIRVDGTGTLIINDGKIICDSKECSTGDAYFAIDVQPGGKLTIKGGTVQNDKCAVVRLINWTKNKTSYFTMDGGTMIAHTCVGVWCQGANETDNCGAVIATFNDGFIDGQNDRYAFQVDGNSNEINILGGTYRGYFDIYGTPQMTVTSGNFISHNGIRIDGEVANFITGGTYYFGQDLIKTQVVDNYVRFIVDAQGNPVCESYDTFAKWYGELGTKEGWEALGYSVEEATSSTGKEGTWYQIFRYTLATEDYTNFLQLIADGYMAVDITGTSEGRTEGTWPDKTVIIKQVEEVILSGTQDWTSDKTDETSAVIIEAGANITIPAGTTVEAYSVNVPTGTTLNVENGATLIVGAGGVTTATGEEAISINIGSNDGSGAIKISPDAPADKAQPRVRINLTTIAHQDAQGNSHWQYFARPTGMTPESFKVIEDKDADKHYIRGYVGETDSYIDITGPSQFANYEGYAITNNSTNGGVVYQFEGKLNANQNAEIKFKNNGFSLMGNSYLAPVSVEGLFKGIIEGVTVPNAPSAAPVAFKAPMEDGGNAVEWTIWIYNCANERFEQTNLLQAQAKKKQLQPMQGFFMKLREGSSLNAAIDYVGAVWNNNATAGPILAPVRNENGLGIASIMISANGCADQIDLFEDAEFDNSFNNGADASKLMNLQGMFNLYAQTEAGTLSCVASDNIEGTILTFQANNASEYELSFNGVENMNYSLIDLTNGEIVEMNEGNVYKFNAVPNSTEARFQIVEGYKAPTAMEKVNNVKAAKGIYSVTGAYIGEVKNFNALPAGIYIVNGQQIVK